MIGAYDEIRPLSKKNEETFVARIPGSKSYTNRALVLAAQKLGRTEITGALHSDDTRNLARALDRFGGLTVQETKEGFVVERTLEQLDAPKDPLDVGGAGTPARLLLSFAIAARGETVVTGSARLRERPMGHLLEAFEKMGVRFTCLATPGCLPVRVRGGVLRTDQWEIDGSVSSQFTTSLLIFAASRDRSTLIRVKNHLVSRPYVEMTVRMLRDAGIRIEHDDAMRELGVYPAPFKFEKLAIEADASAMSYFLGAAALTGSTVRIPGIGRSSVQGDVELARALENMGCSLEMGEHAIELRGRPLRAIDVDMERMPDVVLTLAVVAARATETTSIRNIQNLRVKESDRIAAAANELARIGVRVEEGPDFLRVVGQRGELAGRVHTYDDHRVAMSFGLLKLLHKDIEIEDPACASKSFPGFWDELARFCRHHEGAR